MKLIGEHHETHRFVICPACGNVGEVNATMLGHVVCTNDEAHGEHMGIEGESMASTVMFRPIMVPVYGSGMRYPARKPSESP